ncbi:hypothetical protein P280DRAFT_38634 [Massarina eburnea CBS 473.64]|uniref:Uncharacterized protein n=1 Tax=Massarina eburnea CBS 473.64 TaxID=1395130 RepID=A0A6A6RVX0_9PLEO|nr:hypothetical protein P280DRAFT_38634 [Massarina eburnea CBS 473.64]
MAQHHQAHTQTRQQLQRLLQPVHYCLVRHSHSACSYVPKIGPPCGTAVSRSPIPCPLRRALTRREWPRTGISLVEHLPAARTPELVPVGCRGGCCFFVEGLGKRLGRARLGRVLGSGGMKGYNRYNNGKVLYWMNGTHVSRWIGQRTRLDT